MHFIQLTVWESDLKTLINIQKICHIRQYFDGKAIRLIIDTDDATITVNEDYETVVAMLSQLRNQDVYVTTKVSTPRTPEFINRPPELPSR